MQKHPPFNTKSRGEIPPPFHRSLASLKLPVILLCKGTYVPHFKRHGGQCPRHALSFRCPCWDKSLSNRKTPERCFVGNYELQSHHHHQVLLEQILKTLWNLHNWNEPLQCSNNPPQYFGPKIRSTHHQFPARLRSNHLLCHCLNVLSL